MPDPPPKRLVAPSARARVGLAVAALTFAALWFAPLSLTTEQHRLAAIFGAVVVLWISEALPIAVTALLIAPAMIVCGVTDAKSAFASYADPLLFLFVGGFFIARAMSRHGLDVRIARACVTLPGIAGHPRRVQLAFMGTAMLLSMWISNTATCAILVPILLGTSREEVGDRPGAVLAVAYACSIGGLGTLVGSPPNSISARFLRDAGLEFDFLDWMAIGLPTALLLLGLAFFVVVRTTPAGGAVEDVEVADPPSRSRRGQRVTMLAFGLAVVGWMVPGLLAAADVPGGAALKSALPGGAVALLAASVLFVFRDESDARVLPWKDAARIDWGIIMLFGGGIALGTQMADGGLAESLAQGFVDATGIESQTTLIVVVTFFTIFFTEVCSNTASANMLVPLVIPIAERMGISPLQPAIAVALAASCAFMLPVATGPNAIAYGSGQVPASLMLRRGLALNLVCGVAICGVVLLLG